MAGGLLAGSGSQGAGTPNTWEKRHTQVMLVAMCSAINYADRVNISIAVVDMKQSFGWEMATQAMVLSSFFWGCEYSSYLAGCPPWLPRRSLPCWETRIYGVGTDESCCVRLVLWAADICSQVTGALLAQRYGGKIVLGSAGLAWSVLTCLTPLAASLGMAPLITCRVLLGVAEGFLIPVNSHIVASWVPADERGRAVSAVIAGCNCGTVAAFMLSPIIMVSLGWPYCFYIFGSAGFVWYAAWQIYAEDVPLDAKSIAAREESMLSQLTSQAVSAKRMLSSKAVWAITICHWCSGVGNYIGLAWFPTYFSSVWCVWQT
jgi:ACS family sodium-dependent inorganic phosphate cotransporter